MNASTYCSTKFNKDAHVYSYEYIRGTIHHIAFVTSVGSAKGAICIFLDAYSYWLPTWLNVNMGATYNGFAGIRDYAQFYIDSLNFRAMHTFGVLKFTICQCVQEHIVAKVQHSVIVIFSMLF